MEITQSEGRKSHIESTTKSVFLFTYLIFTITYLLISFAVITKIASSTNNGMQLLFVIAMCGLTYIYIGMKLKYFKLMATLLVEFVLSPFNIRFISNLSPSLKDIYSHIHELRKESENPLLVVEVGFDGLPERIVIDFISGNLVNQISISKTELSTTEYSEMSFVAMECSGKYCRSCEDHSGPVYNCLSSDIDTYVDQPEFYLCGKCIGQIIEKAVENMGEDSQKEIVASNL